MGWEELDIEVAGNGPYVGRGLFVGGIVALFGALCLWIVAGVFGSFAVGPVTASGTAGGLAGIGLAATFVAVLVGSGGRPADETVPFADIGASSDRGTTDFERANETTDRAGSGSNRKNTGEPTSDTEQASNERHRASGESPIDRIESATATDRWPEAETTPPRTEPARPRRADGGVDAIRFDASVDRYCGNCTHFQYVRTESGMAPYCGYHEEVMDDMESCLAWQSNART